MSGNDEIVVRRQFRYAGTVLFGELSYTGCYRIESFNAPDLRHRGIYHLQIKHSPGHLLCNFYPCLRVPAARQSLRELLLFRQDLCVWERQAELPVVSEGQHGTVQ